MPLHRMAPHRMPRRLVRRSIAHARTLSPAVRGMLWTTLAGVCFCILNAIVRALAAQLDPLQAQFLRYLMGTLILVPLVLRSGLASSMPKRIGGQFWRGFVHTVGLVLWFMALPRIPLADMTAIGFTGPIFVMIGAAVFFKEPMRWERWLAAAIGFAGVLVVVGPKLGGSGGWYNLVMLASAPVFALSFLITKALTRTENAQTIVLWQAISVTLFSLPLALPVWQSPSAAQWAGFLVCGALGSAGHYCLTRSFAVTDLSATQGIKFLDLVWASLLGWLVFADTPSAATLLGGAIILAGSVWLAHRESRRREPVVVDPA